MVLGGESMSVNIQALSLRAGNFAGCCGYSWKTKIS